MSDISKFEKVYYDDRGMHRYDEKEQPPLTSEEWIQRNEEQRKEINTMRMIRHTETVDIRLLDHAVELPEYKSAGASGVDLAAAFPDDIERTIHAGCRMTVPTGVSVAIPEGYEIQIRPKSGNALRHGLTIVNTPGTIDCDYRGEIMLLVLNTGDSPFHFKRGTYLAQAVLCPVVRIQWNRVDTLPVTARGAGGFGSTGDRTVGVPSLPVATIEMQRLFQNELKKEMLKMEAAQEGALPSLIVLENKDKHKDIQHKPTEYMLKLDAAREGALKLNIGTMSPDMAEIIKDCKSP